MTAQREQIIEIDQQSRQFHIHFTLSHDYDLKKI